MNAAWRFGRDVTGNATRETELFEQLLHPFGVLSHVGILLGVAAFQVRIGDQARPTMSWAGDVDHVQVISLDDAVQVCIDEVQTRRRAPVPQQSGLDVFFAMRFFQKRIIEKLDLANEQVVRRPPKGAVEVILSRRTFAMNASGDSIPLEASVVNEQVETMAAKGLRVLAFAGKELPSTTCDVTHEDVGDLVFFGLQGMIDPPRVEAMAAIKACHTAGIRVKMITGDHALTACAIAEQLGLGGIDATACDVMLVKTASNLEGVSDFELIDVADQTTVFARATTELKLRLVRALQAKGHIVAMTGDGVNDAPALKQADIGIAMGIGGTEVAKEAADMVLTDDDFASIEAAVEEGRGVFDNLTKYIVWNLPTSIGEGLVILAAVFAGATLPILPVQILWINMTTAVLLGVMLAFEPKELDIMRRPPRNPNAAILSKTLVGRIVTVSLIMLAGAFGSFEWALNQGYSDVVARTVSVNVFVFVELFYLFNCRSLTRSMFEIGLLSNRWIGVGVASMVILQLAYTYAPFMNKIFHSAPIGLDAWWRILLTGIFVYAVVGFEKWLRCYGRDGQLWVSNMKTIIFLLLTSLTSTAGEIVVRDDESLRTSLRDLKVNTTLKIAPGDYSGGHYVKDVENLTLEALDPKNPPLFKGGGNGFQFSRCKNLTLRNLRFSGQTENGINLDDGGLFDQPIIGITLEQLVISDIGPKGNHDGIKCSGLDKLIIRDCNITGWGGQGIDLVGCHRSLITGCRFQGKPGFSATAGVQTKGGSSNITVEKCHFIHSGERPLNVGGSTGLNLFRPPGAKYEAKDITVRDNIIEGSPCAAAFVGVDGAEFVGNTILFPEKWILRVLQETTSPGYAKCRNVVIKDNRIVFRRSQVQAEVNVGGNTEPKSFRFEGNRWFAEDRPQSSKPRLPTEEQGGTYGTDPR